MTGASMPCPYCRSHDIFSTSAKDDPDHDVKYPVVAACGNCGAFGPDRSYSSGADAFAAWDRRADLPPTLSAALELPEIKALTARAEAAEARVAELEAATREVTEAWPAVLAIIRDYDEQFPYAELDGDDEKVTRLNKAIIALKGDKP